MQHAGISTQAWMRVKLQLWNSWNSNWAQSWYSNWIDSEDVKQRHAMWNAHMESDFNQRQKLFETTLSGTCVAAGWCNSKKCRLANLKSLTPGPACCFKSERTHKTELDVRLSLNPPRALMGRAAASERPGNLGLNLKWMPISRRASQLWHNCQTWYMTSTKFWGSSRYPICMQYISHIFPSSKHMPYIWGNVMTPKIS